MNDSQKTPIIKCENIHKYFGQGNSRVHVLRGIDMKVYPGELRMLMGPSGSGKTTLISIIAGILTQSEGTCLVKDVDVNHLPDYQRTHFRGKNIGFVFQMFNLIPTLTNEENVSIPLCLLGVPREEAIVKAKTLLKQVDLEDKIGVYPRDLSGGQQQRVAIARAMVHDPPILVCDEPTSFLDHVTGKLIMELLKDFSKKKNITVIVITHDPRIIEFADKINYIEDGKLSDTPAH